MGTVRDHYIAHLFAATIDYNARAKACIIFPVRAHSQEHLFCAYAKRADECLNRLAHYPARLSNESARHLAAELEARRSARTVRDLTPVQVGSGYCACTPSGQCDYHASTTHKVRS